MDLGLSGKIAIVTGSSRIEMWPLRPSIACQEFVHRFNNTW